MEFDMENDSGSISSDVVLYIDRRVESGREQLLEIIEENARLEAKHFKEYQEEARQEKKRHTELLTLIQGYMAKMDKIAHKSPCPELASSIPMKDWTGHRDYHLSVMEWNKRMTTLKWFVISAVVGSVVISILAWIGVLMWGGFLEGPFPNEQRAHVESKNG